MSIHPRLSRCGVHGWIKRRTLPWTHLKPITDILIVHLISYVQICIAQQRRRSSCIHRKRNRGRLILRTGWTEESVWIWFVSILRNGWIGMLRGVSVWIIRLCIISTICNVWIWRNLLLWWLLIVSTVLTSFLAHYAYTCIWVIRALTKMAFPSW